MTQGFDDFKKEFGVNDSPYSAEHYIIESSFKAGAASRQAEINELQKRIDDALDYVFGLYCTGDLDTERLENILKGESNE